MFPLDNVPASLTHIAFPLGFVTGLVGWRFPGIVVTQNLNHGSAGPASRLDLVAFERSWSGHGNNINYLTAGNAGFRPQLVARLHVQGLNWRVYVMAHRSQIDVRGVGNAAPTPIQTSVNSVGVFRPGAG
jgi:hypothetical protein